MKPKLAGHVITCHSWISTSRMALGTKSGRIVIIEEADVVTFIPLDVNDPRASRMAQHNERCHVFPSSYYVNTKNNS